MKTNGRPAIVLKPHEVLTYGPDQATTVRCRDCGKAKGLKRGTIVAHDVTERGYGAKEDRCDGGRQRVVINFTVEQWKERLEEGLTETRARRATTPLRKPRLAPKPAVSQMQPGTARLRRQLADHQADCLTCRRPRLWCEEATVLTRRINKLRQQPAPGISAAEMKKRRTKAQRATRPDTDQQHSAV